MEYSQHKKPLLVVQKRVSHLTLFVFMNYSLPRFRYGTVYPTFNNFFLMLYLFYIYCTHSVETFWLICFSRPSTSLYLQCEGHNVF